MPTVEIYIAKGAYKTATNIAGVHGLLARVVKATGLALVSNAFPTVAPGPPAEQGRKNIHPQRYAARRAGDRLDRVERAALEACAAFRADNQRDSVLH
jgi:hypothetical protein